MLHMRPATLLVAVWIMLLASTTIPCEGASRTATFSNTRPTLSLSKGTKTPSVTRSELVSTTITKSMSPTWSIPQEVYQPIIFLESSALMSSKCFTTEVDTQETSSCRQIVFRMVNDGFNFNSDVYTFFVQHFVFQFVAGDIVNPFGFRASWQYFVDNSKVHSNVTHLTFTFPRRRSLSVLQPTTIAFNWSFVEIPLRRQKPTSNSSFLLVIQPFEDYEPSVALVAIQTASGIVGSIAGLMPVAPTFVDSQILILAGTLMCAQPDVRHVSIEGRRFLYPSAPIDADAARRLQHNLIVVFAFTFMHLITVLFVMTKKRCGFWNAASSVLFPGLSFSVAIYLHVGITHTAFELIISQLSTKTERGVGFLGLCYLTTIVLATPVLALKYFKAESRTHELALYDFPPVFQFVAPESSWGPLKVLGPWFIPLGAMGPGKIRHCSNTLVYTTVLAIVLAIEPTTPKGCAAIYILATIFIVFYGLYLIRAMPFRSRYTNISTAVAKVFMMVPLLKSVQRCMFESQPTSNALWIMFTVVHLLSFLQSCGAILGTLLEWWFIRRRVWPDDEAETDTIDLDKQLEEAMVIKERDASAHLLDPADVEMMESMVVDQTQTRIQTGARDFAEEEEGAERDSCVLGQPPPLPQRALPKPSKKAAKTNMTLRHPVINLTKNYGPVPPTIAKVREQEYNLL